jgi:spore cortex formation protein SpoVR/YcgB (stage V sporulation)
MAALYDLEDLRRWNDRIVELVNHFGLDPFPQEFEICDYEKREEGRTISRLKKGKKRKKKE